LTAFGPRGLESKQSHYQHLERYLNNCLAKCRDFFPQLLGQYHPTLTFKVYDCQTQDNVFGTSPLQPDLIGIHSPFSDADKASRLSEDLEHRPAVLIPISINDDLEGLLASAFIHAESLYSVSPLRQFALVLGYQHSSQRLHFFVFHSGGVTISEPLYIRTRSGKKEILRLFLSILTWETMGDAGIPAWFKGDKMQLPRFPGDEEGVLLRLKQKLSSNPDIHGKCETIYRCTTSNIDQFVPLSLNPSTKNGGVRRSQRLADKDAFRQMANKDRLENANKRESVPLSRPKRKRKSGDIKDVLTKKTKVDNPSPTAADIHKSMYHLHCLKSFTDWLISR
jgi:hypothetical protein